jgi:hypothetical protein
MLGQPNRCVFTSSPAWQITFQNIIPFHAFSGPRMAEYTFKVFRDDSNSMVSERISSIPDTDFLLHVFHHRNDQHRYINSWW